MNETAAQTEAKEVPKQLDRYDSLLLNLEEAIKLHADRIRPVSTIQPDKQVIGAEIPQEALCDIAHSISVKNVRLANLTDELRDLTKHVEV